MNGGRSVFWPMTFIAAGILWLMINFGVIPTANLLALGHIWPILLIGLGLGLIARGYWPWAGMAVSALVVIAALLAVVFAQPLGWDQGTWWDFTIHIGSGGVQGSGNIVTEERQVASFDSIAISYPADVVIVMGAEEAITVQADDNLLPQLETEVRSGTLHIENRERSWNRRVNPSETVQITITVTELTSIDFKSAGTVRITDLTTDRLSISQDGAGSFYLTSFEADSLELDMNGAGSIKVDGTVTSVEVSLDGLGSLDGEELYAQTANITINGAGKATLHVSDRLDAKVNGAGSIHYYGSPVVREDVDGIGTISKVGE